MKVCDNDCDWFLKGICDNYPKECYLVEYFKGHDKGKK